MTGELEHFPSWQSHHSEFTIKMVCSMLMKKLLFGKNWGCKDNQWHACWHQFYKLFTQQHTGLTVKHKHEKSTEVKLMGGGRKRRELILKAVVHGGGTWAGQERYQLKRFRGWRTMRSRKEEVTQHILETQSPPQRTESAGKQELSQGGALLPWPASGWCNIWKCNLYAFCFISTDTPEAFENQSGCY